MEKEQIIKYRGVKPANIVSVLEGDGKDFPFEIVTYVLGYELVDGIMRQITLGKILPLTEKERSYFA